jgi:hypothetical protein
MPRSKLSRAFGPSMYSGCFMESLMNLFCVFVLTFLALQSPAPSPKKVIQPEQQRSASTAQPSSSDQRGTEEYPLVVKALDTPKTQDEINQETTDRQEKAASNWWMIGLTGVLALIAFGQLAVYLYQAIKLRQTVQSSIDQGKAMQDHIAEAKRSADAMEKIAHTIEQGTLKETLMIGA